MSGKYRRGGVKREHSVMAGLVPVLERIAACPAVSAITPGRISVVRGGAPSMVLRFGTPTISGLKLTARRGTTAQEVFVVTNQPDAVLAFLRAEVREFAG